jgi:hypothetical protein
MLASADRNSSAGAVLSRGVTRVSSLHLLPIRPTRYRRPSGSHRPSWNTGPDPLPDDLPEPVGLSGTERNSAGFGRAEALERAAMRRQHLNFRSPLSYFHNGFAADLDAVVDFYNTASISGSPGKRSRTWSRSSARCSPLPVLGHGSRRRRLSAVRTAALPPQRYLDFFSSITPRPAVPR